MGEFGKANRVEIRSFCVEIRFLFRDLGWRFAPNILIMKNTPTLYQPAPPVKKPKPKPTIEIEAANLNEVIMITLF